MNRWTMDSEGKSRAGLDGVLVGMRPAVSGPPFPGLWLGLEFLGLGYVEP